jgi:hypothetical protein
MKPSVTTVGLLVRERRVDRASSGVQEELAKPPGMQHHLVTPWCFGKSDERLRFSGAIGRERTSPKKL